MADQTSDLRILVPLDGSDLATVSLPFVRAIATDATDVVLMRVVQDDTPLITVYGGDRERIEHTMDRQRDAARSYLQDVAAILTTETGHLAIRTDEGMPHAAILRGAEEEHADLIVMATKGRGFLGRAMVGSVADRVARTSTVPLLLIHPHEHDVPARAQEVGNIRRLVVPLDGSELASQALPVAERFARLLGIPIHLVRAIDLQGEWVLGDDRDDVDALLEPMREDIAEALHRETERLSSAGIGATFELTVGAVNRVIQDTVEPGDVIVMTSHGAGGLRRWLLGSVADKLIRSGVAPVMLVPVAERARIAEPYATA